MDIKRHKKLLVVAILLLIMRVILTLYLNAIILPYYC